MENVFICEAQDLVAHTFQPVLSCFIFCLLGGFLMITTVDFYNQLLLETNKIDDIVAYYMLPPKSHPKFLLPLDDTTKDFLHRSSANDSLSHTAL